MTEPLSPHWIQTLESGLKKCHSLHELPWVQQHILETCNNEAGQTQLVDEILKRKQNAEPLAYIFGHWSFRDYELAVGPGVLIPRPESEELVDIALSKLRNLNSHFVHGADLGSGSGCLGIALCLELKKIFKNSSLFHTYFVDKSNAVLSYLQKNVSKLLNSDSFHSYICSQGWKEWEYNLPADMKFDWIISNPPYVSQKEFEQSDVSVKHFEPASALLPEDIETYPDASGPYREILSIAERRLKPGGWIFFELGLSQPTWILNYVETLGTFESYELRKDMSQKTRFFIAQRKVSRG